MNTVLLILGALGGIGSFIYGLIIKNRALNEKVAQQQASNKIQEWANELKVLDGKLTEDERDYEKSKEKFSTNNPDSGNK